MSQLDNPWLQIANFFKAMFGFKFNGETFGCTPALVVGFVLMILGAIAIATCVILNVTKKGNWKLQLSLSIITAALLIAAGILFLLTIRFAYNTHGAHVAKLAEVESITFDQFKQLLKAGFGANVSGALCIAGGAIFCATNIYYNHNK